jgi:hypothetical protein
MSITDSRIGAAFSKMRILRHEGPQLVSAFMALKARMLLRCQLGSDSFTRSFMVSEALMS